MDLYESNNQQTQWAGNQQIKIYLVAFFSVIVIQDIYLNDFWVLATLGSVWIPQIVRNAVKGFRNTPEIYFAICMSAHAVAVPMYIKATSSNFLFLQPHYSFSAFLFLWVCFQIIVLKVQQTRPRFMLPGFV